MERRIQKLVEELCVAIDRTIRESEHIDSAMDKLRQEGYDVSLGVEATLVVKKQDSNGSGVEGGAEEARLAEGPVVSSSTGEINWTEGDADFLKAMKVTKEDIGDNKG